MIAMALSCNPRLLIADEPTTALDVTIEAQILELLEDLQAEFGMSIMYISHDLAVVGGIADEVMVMYLGLVMEHAPVERIFDEPLHPYTRALWRSIPKIDGPLENLVPISGAMPSPFAQQSGCPFYSRCTEAMTGVCDVARPALTEVHPGHSVRCFLYSDAIEGRSGYTCCRDHRPQPIIVHDFRESRQNSLCLYPPEVEQSDVCLGFHVELYEETSAWPTNKTYYSTSRI